MPSLSASRMKPDPDRYRPAPPIGRAPMTTNPPPILPPHLIRSPVMISSMPAISTNVDGITRQFYNSRGLPTRRLSQL